MLRLADGPERLFPATLQYNEGWLLRLVIDWFSRHDATSHPIGFMRGARWFSEALLPSQFFANSRTDKLAEGWTHADAVIGHVVIGEGGLADTKLHIQASQFVVTEAKMFSPLSAGVTNASYFDQAARNVACIAEVLSRAARKPDTLASLGFVLLAPREQISTGVFATQLSSESIKSKVRRRVLEYSPPGRDLKLAWLEEWFLPTVERASILALEWESVVDFVREQDPAFGLELDQFYGKCITHNRAEVAAMRTQRT